MSYSTTKERLRKAQERLTQSPAVLPVLPVMLPVDVVTGNTVLQVVEQPLVTDVTDVTYKVISHDGCREKNITSGHSGNAVDAYNIFFSVQSQACAENTGNIGNTDNAQVVDVLPVGDETPVTSVTSTGNTPGTSGDFTLTFDVQPATKTLVKHSIADDLGSLPPMRIVSERPALPRDMWLGGLTPSAALAAHARLKQEYFCSCGADAGGWFVRCDPVHYEVTL